MRRLALPLALLLVAAGVVAYALGRDEARSPGGPNAAEDLSEGPLRVVFAEFADGASTVKEHLVAEDRVRDVVELPRVGEVQAAPGSSYLSVEWWDEDVGRPRLTVLDPEGGEEIEVEGAALEALWHPQGDLVAYSEPVDPGRCTPDDCPGDLRVLVLDPATGETEVVVEEGPWFPRFWVGDRILYQDEDDSTIVHVQGLDGERRTIEVFAMGAQSASPDGRWLFVSWQEETAFYPIAEDGGPGGDPVPVDLPGAPMRTVAWAHDSSAVVGASAAGRPELLLMSPDEGSPRSLGEMEGSVTRLGWAPSNDAVFVTFVTDEFQTALCSLEEDAEADPCRPVLEWTTGISTLRVEGSA